jgi:asparagine synthase (glutamine-hydrolysing)
VPGIVGFVSDDVGDRQLLARMVDSIRHEQWYQVDKHIRAPFSVARVHLGTFNPQPQPVFNEDKTLCLFMDGKIHGYDEEKRRLESRHEFAFHNDPEFCLHLYEELGTAFAERLNGPFVIVICDLRQKKVIIANDRYGLLSVYYAVNNGMLLFAPEAKAILQDSTFKRELDTEALILSLAFGESWADRTLFKRVNILPPASILTYESDKLSITQYWRFSYQPDYGLPDKAIVEQLTEAFRRAVTMRMKDGLRYGLSLSGGLDSRALLAAMEPEKRQGITTYSYGPSYCDEVSIAKKVAEKCGTRPRFIEITPDLILQNAEREVWLTDGRDHILRSFLHPVHRQARGQVDVVFDGFMLDLTLGGSYLKKNLIHPGSKEELFASVLKSRTLYGEGELTRLFRPEYHAMVKEAPTSALKAEFGKLSDADPRTTFDEFLWRTHVAYGPSWHVTIRDLVEISFPTVDNDLLAIIFRIPPEKRLNHQIYRKFFKRLAPELAGIPYNRTMVPPSAPLILWKGGRVYRAGKEILKDQVWRASKGRIYIPNRIVYLDHVHWLRTNDSWKSYFRTLLLSSGSLSKEYFDQKYVKYLIEEHEEGRSNTSVEIMRIATVELFMKQFLM